MRRPRQTTLDPALLDGGLIGSQTASIDKYFESGEADDVLTIVVQNFVDKLNEPRKTAVKMCIMQGISYAEAAETISVLRGIQTDPKTVWRWAQQGVQSVGRMLQAAKWTSEVTKVPRWDDEQDESEGYGEGDLGGQEVDFPWVPRSEVTEPVDDA